MEDSKIAWTDHTFNPVRGCRYAELPDGSPSPACEQGPGCYAESMSKRNPPRSASGAPTVPACSAASPTGSSR